MTLFWIFACVCALGAGVCAALTSCFRQQGERQQALESSVYAVTLAVVSIAFGLAAWSTQ